MYQNILPKISVITPSYNQGFFIENTIQSVLSQDYPNLEYIICDGGSTDETLDIIKKYEDKLTWWCSEKDDGQTAAINKGMKKATGEYVCWINSDDVLLPGSLMMVAKFAQKYPNVDFFNGFTAIIDMNGRFVKFHHIIMNSFLFKKGAYNISQQGMFWKRSLFERIGYLDEKFHAKMDVEWLIRIYRNGIPMKKINKHLGAFRVYPFIKSVRQEQIWKNDARELYYRYNGDYNPKRNTIYYKILIFLKAVSGCYLMNRIELKKYKGKRFSEYRGNFKNETSNYS